MIVVCLTGCRHGNATDSILARSQQLLDSDSAYAAASLINESEAQAATFTQQAEQGMLQAVEQHPGI